MIKYLITIVLTIALCCSCDREDFSADPTIMPPATPVSYTHLLQIIQAQLKQLSGLVEHILSMSREQRKNFRLNYEPVERCV